MRHLHSTRKLIVCADDYGMGPETSRGILELACAEKISATVLLVNSPFAEEAAVRWRRAAPACDLGWHPCLTSDSPVLPPGQVPSLVDSDGRFWRLGAFIRRWALGQLRAADIANEWCAQLSRFREITAAEPAIVNTHQHVAAFHPVGEILIALFRNLRTRPFVRRIRETTSMLRQIPGARIKRAALSILARRHNRECDREGLPGHVVLAGVANHADVHDPLFFDRWLRRSPGRIVELMVHPGYRDEALLGRDCIVGDGCMERREREFRHLIDPAFAAAVRGAGFRIVRPSRLVEVDDVEFARAS